LPQRPLLQWEGVAAKGIKKSDRLKSMDADHQALFDKISELETKVDKVYKSSERIRKYFLWTGIITVVVIVGPLLLLPLVIPAFLQSVTLPANF